MAKKFSKKKLGRNHRRKSSETDDYFREGEPSRFSNLPKGTYDGYVKAGSWLIEAKESGGHRSLCTLVVTSPEEFKNRVQVKRDDLSTQVGVNIFLGELEALELGQPKSLRECSEILADTDNLRVRFWVGEPRDENPPKVRFNERLEEANGAEEDEDVDEDAEEETEEKSKKKGKSKKNEYTKKEIRSMDEDELTELIENEGLDIDPDDFDSWDDVADAVIKELGL